jgi:hypothetical protein
MSKLARVKKLWGAGRGAVAGFGLSQTIGGAIAVPASATFLVTVGPVVLASAGVIGGAVAGYKLAKYAGIIGGAVDGGITDGALEGYEQAKKLVEN